MVYVRVDRIEIYTKTSMNPDKEVAIGRSGEYSRVVADAVAEAIESTGLKTVHTILYVMVDGDEIPSIFETAKAVDSVIDRVRSIEKLYDTYIDISFIGISLIFRGREVATVIISLGFEKSFRADRVEISGPGICDDSSCVSMYAIIETHRNPYGGWVNVFQPINEASSKILIRGVPVGTAVTDIVNTVASVANNVHGFLIRSGAGNLLIPLVIDRKYVGWTGRCRATIRSEELKHAELIGGVVKDAIVSVMYTISVPQYFETVEDVPLHLYRYVMSEEFLRGLVDNYVIDVLPDISDPMLGEYIPGVVRRLVFATMLGTLTITYHSAAMAYTRVDMNGCSVHVGRYVSSIVVSRNGTNDADANKYAIYVYSRPDGTVTIGGNYQGEVSCLDDTCDTNEVALIVSRLVQDLDEQVGISEVAWPVIGSPAN